MTRMTLSTDFRLRMILQGEYFCSYYSPLRTNKSAFASLVINKCHYLKQGAILLKALGGASMCRMDTFLSEDKMTKY